MPSDLAAPLRRLEPSEERLAALELKWRATTNTFFPRIRNSPASGFRELL